MDIFGKGRGKTGKGRKPLQCWTCLGFDHPASKCASAPGSGQSKMAPQRNVCNGWGHMGKDCTSLVGGKYAPPAGKIGGREEGKGSKKGYFQQYFSYCKSLLLSNT